MRAGRFGAPDGSFGFRLDLTPVVRNLLIANVAIWFVQVVFARLLHTYAFDNYFALKPDEALPGRPWQLITYMFLHSLGPMHLIGNMFTLAFVGGSVEGALGSRRFLRYYLICGVAGALLTFLPHFRSAIYLGASGAVLGVVVGFGLLFPDAPVVIPFLVVLPAKIVVLFLVLLNVMSALGSSQSGVAYIVHVGGMAAGFAMLRGDRILGRVSRDWERRNRERQARRRAEVRLRMDEILDKYRERGKESLTQEEWRTLLEESKRLRE